MNYIMNNGDYTETIFEEPSSTEGKIQTKEMFDKKYVTSPNRPIMAFEQKAASYNKRSPEKIYLPVIGNATMNPSSNTIAESHLD